MAEWISTLEIQCMYKELNENSVYASGPSVVDRVLGVFIL